jgi:hypothetical protein
MTCCWLTTRATAGSLQYNLDTIGIGVSSRFSHASVSSSREIEPNNTIPNTFSRSPYFTEDCLPERTKKSLLVRSLVSQTVVIDQSPERYE